MVIRIGLEHKDCQDDLHFLKSGWTLDRNFMEAIEWWLEYKFEGPGQVQSVGNNHNLNITLTMIHDNQDQPLPQITTHYTINVVTWLGCDFSWTGLSNSVH